MTKPRRALHNKLMPLTAEDFPDRPRAVQWPHRLEDWQFVHTIGDGLATYAQGRLAGTSRGQLQAFALVNQAPG